MKNKLLVFFFGLIFLIGFVQASGLQIINQSVFNINKSSSQDTTINFILQNQEPIEMRNISFESNPYITFPIISSLSSGSYANITAIIGGSQSFNGNLRIKGLFFQNIGQNFEMHNLSVNLNTGVSECFLTGVEGDSISWTNTLLNSINLINADTNQLVTTISANSSYTQIFSTPQILNYRFTTSGFDFTGNCQATMNSAQGYVNDPDKDALLNLILTINFPATTLELITPILNYTINVGSSSDDIFTIRNLGTETAKNIVLTNEWMTFTLNNFDLSAGQSRNVGYTITPFITNTTQTNQTYIKKLTIGGNFGTIERDFNIFIPYKIVTGGQQSISSLEQLIESYKEILDSYCNEQANKNKEVCVDYFSNSIINQFGQNGTLSDSVLREMSKSLAEMREQIAQENNANKISRENTESAVIRLETNQNQTQSDLDEIKNKQNEGNSNIIWGIVSIFSSAIVLILGYLVLEETEQKKLKSLLKIR